MNYASKHKYHHHPETTKKVFTELVASHGVAPHGADSKSQDKGLSWSKEEHDQWV